MPAVDLDQVHIPDPVAQELCKLDIRLENLEKASGIIPRKENYPSIKCNKENNRKEDDKIAAL